MGRQHTRRLGTHSVALAAVAGMMLFFGIGCEDRVTEENFDAIAVGMPMDEVEDILGPGELQEASGVSIGSGGLMSSSKNSTHTKDYLWETDGHRIVVKFKDGKVVFKQKSGF